MSIRKILGFEALFSLPDEYYHQGRCEVVCSESEEIKDSIKLEVNSLYDDTLSEILYIPKETLLAMAQMFVEEDDDS